MKAVDWGELGNTKRSGGWEAVVELLRQRVLCDKCTVVCGKEVGGVDYQGTRGPGWLGARGGGTPVCVLSQGLGGGRGLLSGGGR